MRSALLSSSQFGRFYQTTKDIVVKTIQLQKAQQLQQCKITLRNQRVYLLDSVGTLSCLNLSDKSLSTLPNCKLQNFHPDSHSSLSLTAVSPSSQILHIQFQNKKIQKVYNPCLSSLVNFKKNYLTQITLLVEPKILIVIDGGKKAKSLKAKGSNLFCGGCFLGINRYISVLLRSGDVQIYQISSLNLVDSIKLPFATNNMKISASNDGKTLVIYGNTSWLFFINFSLQKGLSCKLSELPFNSVLDLQFSYRGHIVLLGSDRVLYGIHFDHQIQLKPLFNHHQQHIPSSFDISINQKTIILIAGKSVHILELKEGLHKAIINSEDGLVICLAQQSSSQHILKVNWDNQISNNQKQDQNKNSEINQQSQFFLHVYQPQQNVPVFDEQKIIVQNKSFQNSLLSWFKNVSLSSVQKNKIMKVFTYLSQSPCYHIVHTFKNETIAFIYKLYRMIPQIRICAMIAYQLLNKIKSITEDGSLERLAIILAPKIVQKFQNSTRKNVNSIIIHLVLNILQEYVPLSSSKEFIKILILNLRRQGFIATYLVNLTLKCLQNDNLTSNKRPINFKIIELQVLNLLKQPRHAYLYAKPSHRVQPVVQIQQGEDLQQLLERQQHIKHALRKIRTPIID